MKIISIKWLGLVLIVTLLTSGLLSSISMSSVASAAEPSSTTASTVEAKNCQTSVKDTPDGLTVKACSYAETQQSSSVKSTSRASVNGKKQLSWVKPNNKLGKLTVAKVRAFRTIHVTYKMTRAQLLRARHGDTCVNYSRGSTWINHGKLGHIKVGFITTVGKRDKSVRAHVMCVNAVTNVIEHMATLYRKGGTFSLRVACGNDETTGTPPTHHEEDFVIVRSEDDVIKDAIVRGMSGGSLNLSGTKVCPGGNVNWQIGQVVYTEAFIHNLLKQRVIAAASGSGYASAMATAVEAARVKAVSKVVTNLHIDCDNPPTQYNPPTISVQASPCTADGQQPGTIDVTITNPNDVAPNAGTSTVSVGNKGTGFDIGANETKTLTFTNYAPGTYSVVVTFGAPINKSVSTQVTVQQCTPPQPPKYVNVSCQTPEEIFVGASYLVQCEVSGNTGVDISLTAKSNDGNSRVSGVKCLSTGTTVCPASGGSFQFRIEGLHEGYTSFSATASSADVSKTFTSDPFPVDPEDGGFRQQRSQYMLIA